MQVVLPEGVLITILVVGIGLFLIFAILSFANDWQWED